MARTQTATAATPARGGRRRARAETQDDNVVAHPTRGRKAASAKAEAPAKAAGRARPAAKTAKAPVTRTRGEAFASCTKCGYEFKAPRISGLCNSEEACAERRKERTTEPKRGRRSAAE